MKSIFDVIRKKHGWKSVCKIGNVKNMNVMGKKTGQKCNKMYSECFWMARTLSDDQ